MLSLHTVGNIGTKRSRNTEESTSHIFSSMADIGSAKKSALVNGGCHKVAINSRHPNVDLTMPPDRFNALGLAVEPWRTGGGHILVAGMSSKNARDLGLGPEQWETDAIQTIKSVTSRRIIYRPKPTWNGFTELPGAELSPPTESLETALNNCFAVVTHHSNVAIDALAKGIPVYTADGAARCLSTRAIDLIVNPSYPDNRNEFFAGLAWWNWSLAEMESGDCWAFVRSQLDRETIRAS